jgi:hypothetical protein
LSLSRVDSVNVCWLLEVSSRAHLFDELGASGCHCG